MICAIPVLSMTNLLVQAGDLPVLIQLGFPQGIESPGVRTQLSANLRHVTIRTGRQHAGTGSVRAAKRDLLAEPDDLALQDGHPGLDVVGGVRHGVMQTTEHVEMLRSSRTLVGWDSHARVRSTACSTVRGAGKRPILVESRRKASRLIQLKPTVDRPLSAASSQLTASSWRSAASFTA